MTFHRSGGNAFLADPRVSSGWGRRWLLTNLSHQALPLKKKKDLSKSNSGTYFSLRVAPAGMAFVFSDPAINWRLPCEGSIQGSITIMPSHTPCLTIQPV